MSRAELSRAELAEPAEQSRANRAMHSRAEPTKMRRVGQNTDGRDSTVGLMDQRMEFSLVEREC